MLLLLLLLVLLECKAELLWEDECGASGAATLLYLLYAVL